MQIRQTSQQRRRDPIDLKKTPSLSINRVPQTLPSHRQDILYFMRHFTTKVTNAAAGGQKVPSGPYQNFTAAVCGEHSQQSTSAESNKPDVSGIPLLPLDETRYLKLYGRELFDDMVEHEYKSQFNALLTNQLRITRQLRAAVIDWLFEVGEKLKIDDKQVLFQAVNLMDRFYSEQTQSLPSKDLQLTAVTALFIASKNLEVDPIDLKLCVSTLGFNKYSKTQFVDKEAAIRQACNYENEAPSSLDFIMLYTRLLKVLLQEQIKCTDFSLEFLFNVHTIAYDLSKSVTLDAGLLRYQPHVLSACMIYLGF